MSLIRGTSRQGPSGFGFGSRGLVNAFDNRSDALPHADAHGRQAIAATTLFHFVNEGGHDPRPATAEGMTEGDGPAVDV